MNGFNVNLQEFFNIIKDGLEKVSQIKNLENDSIWNDLFIKKSLFGKKSPKILDYYDFQQEPQPVDVEYINQLGFFKLLDFYGFCRKSDDQDPYYGVIFKIENQKHREFYE